MENQFQIKVSGIFQKSHRFFAISRDKINRKDVLHVSNFEGTFAKLEEICSRPFITNALEVSKTEIVIGGQNKLEIIDHMGNSRQEIDIKGYANVLRATKTNSRALILCLGLSNFLKILRQF